MPAALPAPDPSQPLDACISPHVFSYPTPCAVIPRRAACAQSLPGQPCCDCRHTPYVYPIFIPQKMAAGGIPTSPEAQTTAGWAPPGAGISIFAPQKSLGRRRSRRKTAVDKAKRPPLARRPLADRFKDIAVTALL